MDNNSYEQSFTQNIKASAPPVPKSSHNTLFIIVLILLVFSIVLHIVSLVFLSNAYNALSEVTSIYEDEIESEDQEDFKIYTYNENGSIKSMTETCQDDSYGYYVFEDNGLYQLYDNNPQNETSLDVGTYRFTDDNTITLNSATQGSRNLVFNKTTLIEGPHTFTCLNATTGEGEE